MQTKIKTDRSIFTLIELLVVIAIIGILAALIFPVLSLAKKAAKRATCCNRLKQISSALSIYQHDYRQYPARLGQKDFSRESIPSLLYDEDEYKDQHYDWTGLKTGGTYQPRTDLGSLSPYINLNDFQCPFVEKVNVTDTSKFSRSQLSYRLYFNWWLNDPDDAVTGDKSIYAMWKLTHNMRRNLKEFNIIAADLDMNMDDGSTQLALSSHPDLNDSMKLVTSTDPAKSVWQNTSTYLRGRVDMNFARKDGGVFTLPRLKPKDSRCRKIDYKFGNGGKDLSLRWSLLPSDDQF